MFRKPHEQATAVVVEALELDELPHGDVEGQETAVRLASKKPTHYGLEARAGTYKTGLFAALLADSPGITRVPVSRMFTSPLGIVARSYTTTRRCTRILFGQLLALKLDAFFQARLGAGV